MAEKKKEILQSPVTRAILSYYHEARHAKHTRMLKNRDNFETYNHRANWSHKTKGQSKEFIPKQSVAVENLVSFLQQGLVDHDKWFAIDDAPGYLQKNIDQRTVVTKEDMEKILGYFLKKNDFQNYVADGLKLGFLGSLMISKIGGKKESIISDIQAVLSDPEDEDSEKVPEITWKDVWCLDLGLVRQEDFYPDPTGRDLYIVERIEIDKHMLLKIAKRRPDIYNVEAIEQIGASQDENQKHRKSRETDQDVTFENCRQTVTIFEAWGTFLEQGTGKILHENSRAACSHEGIEILKPHKIENWHGEDPYVSAPIIRIPKSVWHKALMDASTQLNQAQNELFNLMLDSGLMSVHGIKQIRHEWLSDPSEVSDGIAPGQSIGVNSMCPPGGKVLERVDTGGMTNEGINMYNLVDREGNASSMSSAISLGSLPERNVKATEIVASSQTRNTLFTGITKLIEEGWVKKLLEKSWKTAAQNIDNINGPELVALLGEEKAAIISQKSNAEIYAETVGTKRFRVFGLSTTANKLNDFRRLTALLQTISGSEVLAAEFRKDYSFTKYLAEIMKSLDINVDKIKATDEEKAQANMENQMRLQAMQAQTGGQPDLQSQIPQDSGSPEQGTNVNRRALLEGMTTPGGTNERS